MSIEMCCGQCDGRILIETPGVIVACPHCGVHLSIPAELESFPAHQTPPAAHEPRHVPGFPVSTPAVPLVPSSALEGDEKSRDETIVVPRSGIRPTLIKQLDPESQTSVLSNGDDEEAGHDRMTGVDLPRPTGPSSAAVSPPATEPQFDPDVLADSPAVPIATGLSWIRAAMNPAHSEKPEVIQVVAPEEAASVPVASSAPESSSSTLEGSSTQMPQVPATLAAPTVATPTVATPIAALASTEIRGTMPDFSWMSQGTAPTASTGGLPSFQFDPTDNSLKQVDAVPGSAAPNATSAPLAFPQFGTPATSDVPQATVASETLAKTEAMAQTTATPVAPSETFPTPAVVPPDAVNPVNAASLDPMSAPAVISDSQPMSFGMPAPALERMPSPPAIVNVAGSSAGSDLRRQEYPTTLLMALGTYASLVTIYLVYLLLFGRTQQLESLPDLKTVQQQGGRAAVPRPENFLPPGHDLRFGQSERYGNIRVTPLRVTRGPMAFIHYTGDEKRERLPSEPVLKLWLKFENVSSDQTITPLDSTLMFFRRDLPDRVVSYNVIFKESDRKQKEAPFHYPFDRLSSESEWRIAGQPANESLAPHAALEMFVPSEEGIEGLDGDLVWRVHFRKGYGPQSGNGITTLVDVHFKSDEIRPDNA